MSQTSWYFLGILSTALLKLGLILVFFGRIKIGLVFGFCGCHFIGIGLVSVCHFPESGISIRYCASVAQYVYSLSAEHCLRLRNNAISDERVRDCAISTHSMFRPLHGMDGRRHSWGVRSRLGLSCTHCQRPYLIFSAVLFLACHLSYNPHHGKSLLHLLTHFFAPEI